MRTIDADALLERVDEERKYLLERGLTGAEHILVHNFRDLIDNAPTVFDCRSCKNNGNERECVDCHDYCNFVKYEERPQGDWIDHSETDGYVECPFCGSLTTCWSNKVVEELHYCFNCGAELKRGGSSDV